MMHGVLNRSSNAAEDELFFSEPVPVNDTMPAIATMAPSSSFGDRKGPNWIAMAGIVGAHVALLVALVKLDIIQVHKAKVHNLVVVNLSEPAPPPIVKPEPIKQVEQVVQQVVTPVPVIQTIAPPPPIAVTNTPPPAPKLVIAEAAPTPPSPAGPVEISDIDEPTYVPSLTVPAEARRTKRGPNTVKVHLIIDTNGKVAEVSMVQGTGLDSLDESILRFVKRWRFKPVIRAGKAVVASAFTPVTVNVPG